jgi:hypothetical protein
MEGCKLIESRLTDACGCIEEEWDTPAGYMSLHLTPDGHGELFFDNGDSGEWEVEITGKDQADFRVQLVNYIDSLPVLDD